MLDGSLDTLRVEQLLIACDGQIIACDERRGKDDLAITELSRFHVAQGEMQALAYGQEEIAEFLSTPENLSFVIKFCRATGETIQKALATELAFD